MILRAALVLMTMLAVAVPRAAALAPAAAPLRAFDTTKYYDKAEFDAAILPYTQAISRNANDARAHFWLGVAYLHVAKFYRFGIAPFAAGFDGRAVASLEQSVRLQAAPEAMLALLEAYALVGAQSRYSALLNRVTSMAQPLPLK